MAGRESNVLTMREPGWIVGGAGAAIAFVVVAYALLVADFAGGPDSSATGSQVRMVLVGFIIATVSLSVGAALRHSDRWPTHVFVGLGALLSIFAMWWAVGTLIG